MTSLTSRLRTLHELPIVRTFVAYFMVGGVCALVDIGTFSALLDHAGLHYLAAGAISFVISTGINYYLGIRFVFRNFGRSRRDAILLVYLTSAIAIAIHFSVLSGLVELYGIDPKLAKIAGIGAGFCWNFTSRYFWIFRR
jgi:putative flippase GtrA